MPQRRNLGGARREASERVVLKSKGAGEAGELSAWTLNVSRGGLRVVVEDPVIVGGEYFVEIGEADPRPVKIVWVREEADGQIAGMKFEDVEHGEVPPSAFPPA